jgi:V/A-type H+-transporting ATPase subunit D
MTLALNKSSLKQQQDLLALYRRFLPSLDLKRQQLMATFKRAQVDLRELEAECAKADSLADPLYALLGSATFRTRDLSQLMVVKEIKLKKENVAGVRLPFVEQIEFSTASYSTLATPFWIDQYVEALKARAALELRVIIQRQRVELLESATRRITQRVNLFEKVLIPRAQQDIKRIQIFLADLERSAVVRSKIAKMKSGPDARGGQP